MVAEVDPSTRLLFERPRLFPRIAIAKPASRDGSLLRRPAKPRVNARSIRAGDPFVSNLS